MENNKIINFSQKMSTLCSKICNDMPQLQHIITDKIAFGIRQTYSRGGYLAHTEAMRHKDGIETTIINGETYTSQKLVIRGIEYLYSISFYIPRLYLCPPKMRIVTIFHELWHISPKFNGYLRVFNHPYDRFHGDYKKFDRYALSLAIEWLTTANEDEYDFLIHPPKAVNGIRISDAYSYPEWDPHPFVSYKNISIQIQKKGE